MPIDVTCDECFTPHRVKSEHAGRRFKCRECGASLVVPKQGQATETAAPPPETGRASKPASKSKSKKRRAAASSRGPSWTQGKPAWIAGGVGLLILLLLIWPSLLHILSIPLALTGIALALWGGLKCLASAFEEDFTCGLMWLFVPLYNVFYMFTRWDRVGPYFLTFVGGLLLMWAPLYGVKLMADAQWAEVEQTFNAELSPTVGAPMQPDLGSNIPAPGVASQPTAENHAGGRPDFRPEQASQTNAAAEMPDANSPGYSGAFSATRPGNGSRQAARAADDGRPAPLLRPPEGAERFHPTRNPVQQGGKVWITDKGRWYPGTVVELTDNITRYLVQYDGWEDRAPVEVNIAWLRHRTSTPE